MEQTVSLQSLRESLDSVTTVAAVSSRLGRNPILHRHVCRFLCRSTFDCRSRGGSLIVAAGSAIEPWALRSAELFGVPVIRIAVGKRHVGADFFVPPTDAFDLIGDQVVIDLADRVDGVYVRRRGAIERHLRQRIASRRDATTRVAITEQSNCAAARLISAGAIGWYYAAQQAQTGPDQADDAIRPATGPPWTDNAWTRTDGQWLVHCTRAPAGRWPDETIRQYRDSILIGDSHAADREPLDALTRIIRHGRLIAAATASSRDHLVVCFSELPLVELLDRRCFRPHLGRWDYEPYGIAIRRTIAKSIGIKPVIYGQPELRTVLPARDRYRFHPIGKTYDWRGEREWRCDKTIDLNSLDPADVRVFAADSAPARERLADCRWRVSLITQTVDQHL